MSAEEMLDGIVLKRCLEEFNLSKKKQKKRCLCIEILSVNEAKPVENNRKGDSNRRINYARDIRK